MYINIQRVSLEIVWILPRSMVVNPVVEKADTTTTARFKKELPGSVNHKNVVAAVTRAVESTVKDSAL